MHTCCALNACAFIGLTMEVVAWDHQIATSWTDVGRDMCPTVLKMFTFKSLDVDRPKMWALEALCVSVTITTATRCP